MRAKSRGTGQANSGTVPLLRLSNPFFSGCIWLYVLQSVLLHAALHSVLGLHWLYTAAH